MPLSSRKEYVIILVWADECCRWYLPRLYKSAGGDRMSDYEMIMIFLTILTLLYMAEKRNDK